MSKYKFPKDFMWGAATSSHQVEGFNFNDWARWEDEGHVHKMQKSGRAADHWNRYEEDFDILQKLNLNAYRFSIEWSKIEPDRGQYDEKAIMHYRKMIMALKERNITPVVTLHHFTNPDWLKNWTNHENSDYFLEYVQYVIGELGDLVEYWITINEPTVFIAMGYQMDVWPPGLADNKAALKALRNLVHTHKDAYKLIHKNYKENGWPLPKISMSFNLHDYYSNANPINKLSASIARSVGYALALNKTRKYIDFIGVNYYFSHKVRVMSASSFTDIKETGTDLPKNDLGWDIYSNGLYNVLRKLKKYKLPIIITENGIPDEKDKQRAWFIREHIKSVARAIEDGVDVQGYLHWSLMDNFEWADGYKGRFGLVEIDFKTQKRTIRQSAKDYAKIAKSNEIEMEG